MQKKTIAIAVIVSICALIAACKKDSKPAPAGNVPHALSDSFYWRAKLDTTWHYQGDANKNECESANGLCSSFYGGPTFSLIDSANPHPHDSIIRSWVGKTFVTRNNDSASHAYVFSFKYQDTLNRTVSTEYTPNYGTLMTITSVTPNGHATLTPVDSPFTYYNLYKVKGTFSANVVRNADTNIIHITQGDFSINVMESTYQ